MPRATLSGVLRKALEAEVLELTGRMVEELGTMRMYWTNTQVDEFLGRACVKG